jgi:tape measure domain-containing protein
VSTNTQLAGSITIDPAPFIAGLQSASTAFNSLTNLLANNGPTVTNPLLQGLNAAQNGFSQFQASMQAGAQSMNNLGGAFQDALGRWHAANGQFLSSAQLVALGLQNTGAAASQCGSALQGMGAASVAAGMLIAQMATSIIHHITSLASSALESGLSFLKMKEQATTAFTNMMGSADMAKGFIQELAVFANTTPFEMPELVRAAQKFMAMGFSAQEVIPILTSVGNAVAAMGGNSQMIDRVTTALVQMKAKGKVSAQEMMQLAEAGIPAWQILAEKIGTSIPNAMKLGEKGALSATMAIAALTEGMDKRFGGMMEKQSHTFAGLMSTIKDTSQQVLGSVLEPLFVKATGAMQGFVNLLPSMQAGIAGISDQAKIATVAFVGLGLATGAAATAIAFTLGGPAALAVVGLGAQVTLVTTAIITNFGQVGSMLAAWTGDTQINFSTVMKWIGMGADAFAIFARSIIQGVDVIGTALVVMGQAFKGAIGVLQGFGTTVKGVLSFDPTAIIAGTTQMQGAFGNMTTGISGQVSLLTQRIKSNMSDTLANINGKYASGFQSFAGKVGGAFTQASNKASEFVKDLGKMGKDANKNAEDLMGAKGAKKGRDQTAAILKLALDDVNAMLDTLGVKVKISKDYWSRITEDTKIALKAQSAVVKEFNEALKNLAINRMLSDPKIIRVAIGDYVQLGDAITRLKEKGVEVNIVYTELADVLKISGDSAAYFAKTAGPAIEEFFDRNKDNLEAMTDGLKEMAVQSGKAFKAHVEHWFEGGKAAKAWGKVMTDAVKELKDQIKSNLGDGVGGILIAFADKFKINLTKINDWSSGVLDIVGALPGKIGDKLRKVTDTFSSWVNRIDSLLRGLHKIFNSIPDGLGPMIQSVVGLFKKVETNVQSTVGSINTSLNSLDTTASTSLGSAASSAARASTEMHESMHAIGASAGKASDEVNKAAQAIVASIGAVATFAGTRGQGKFTGVLGGAAAGAQIGSLFGPVGTIVGAGVGAIAGLFGSGKSSAQKKAEEEAKQRAGLDMQKFAADVMSAQMEGLKKGLELLEGLKTFSEVPRKAIKRFFNEIEMILQLFAEMAGKFKADSVEQSKALSEIMSGSFGALMSGADLINAIKAVASITEENISTFITTTMKLITAWSEAASTIELQSAKFTGKISEKLMSSFAFLQVVPEVIKGFAESVKVDDSIIDAVFATANNFITKMKEMSEQHRGMELNRTGASASIFSTIFESAKGMLELFTQFAAYKAMDEAVLSVITSDLQKLLSWGDGLIALGESGISKFETLGDVIGRMAAAMRGATAGISALTGGGSTEGITANIQSGNGAGLLRAGGGSSSSTTVINQTTNITQNVQAATSDSREQAELIRRIVKEENEKLRRELLLSSVS